ncbi:MAG: Bax inhibitor-1/YccA family protein [Chitinophagaceae bacterium]
MNLFKSGNPALSEKTFKGVTFTTDTTSVMTVNGTLNKFGFMTIMLVAGAMFSWKSFYDGAPYAQTLMWVGLIGGLVMALAIIFKKEWSGYLAPAYAVLEGLFLGAISATYDYLFSEKMPNIIINAVGLTVGTCVAMFVLYRFGIIKATEKFKSIIFTATAGIAIFYVITMVIRMFGVQMPFMHDSSLLGIGISLFIVAIAALNLIIDFDMIEQGAAQGAPKYMEWYGGFGLMVTIVWLYLEILRLLSRFAGRD